MRRLVPLLALLVLTASAAGCIDSLEGVTGGGEKEKVKAVIEVSATKTTVDKGVRFDGGGSEGDVESYQWDFGDGSTSDEENPTHAYKKSGNYTVTLTVEDSEGDKDTATITVVVNAPPSAAFSVSDDTPQVHQTIRFTAQESTDSDGNIEEYDWDFGDGASSDAVEVQHSYSDKGEYRVRLTVRDDLGATDTAELVLKVTLRVFQVTWVVENETVSNQSSAQEFESANYTFTEMDRNNLVYVMVELSWDDRQPVNVVSEGNDNFTLTVWPPGSSGRNESSEYEYIAFDWTLNEVPEDFQVEARTEAEARDSIDAGDFETRLGRGPWEARVYLGEAGDGLLQDGGVFPDTSNSYTLRVNYQYYSMKLVEVTD